MTEKFERKVGVPAERDVAKRSYYLAEGRIRTLYHYPDGDVTRARKVRKVFHKLKTETLYKNMLISSLRDTLYPWTGLPIKSVLVGTHVRCLLRDRRRAVLFHSCTEETETRLVSLWKIPGFPPKIRLPCTTNTIPVPDPR